MCCIMCFSWWTVYIYRMQNNSFCICKSWLNLADVTFQYILHCWLCCFNCRSVLDFDFEKLCSVSLSHINVYACLVCGKYFQGNWWSHVFSQWFTFFIQSVSFDCLMCLAAAKYSTWLNLDTLALLHYSTIELYCILFCSAYYWHRAVKNTSENYSCCGCLAVKPSSVTSLWNVWINYKSWSRTEHA